MTVVAIDFETANERRDSACAVGLAWIEGGTVVRRESCLIRPRDLRFSPGNIRVHGILPADVRHLPEFPEVMAPFLPDLERGLVLAHNASFDMGVLRASLAAYGLPVPAFTYLCTVQIARRVFPDPAGCGLGKVAGRLGIRFEHHDAGEDAYACAEIALAAVRERGATDVGDLSRAINLPVTRLPAGHDTTDRPRMSIGSVAERAFRAARPTAEAARDLRFAVRGSRGNRYELVLTHRASGPTLTCTCMAGRYRMRCRHADALAVGDVTDLLSDNPGDVIALGRIMTSLLAVECAGR